MTHPRRKLTVSGDRSHFRILRKFFTRHASAALRHARRTIIFVVGATVVAIGVVMIVTPGPAVVVIPLGLGILAIEFAWARHLLKQIKEQPRNFFGRKPNNNQVDQLSTLRETSTSLDDASPPSQERRDD